MRVVPCHAVPLCGDMSSEGVMLLLVRRGGRNTLVIHNTCEDSLLAAPIILDLVLLAELITRIELKRDGQPFQGMHPVAVLLRCASNIAPMAWVHSQRQKVASCTACVHTSVMHGSGGPSIYFTFVVCKYEGEGNSQQVQKQTGHLHVKLSALTKNSLGKPLLSRVSKATRSKTTFL
jgi:hypothetical protein